jgi:hypothetical protein
MSKNASSLSRLASLFSYRLEIDSQPNSEIANFFEEVVAEAQQLMKASESLRKLHAS